MTASTIPARPAPAPPPPPNMPAIVEVVTRMVATGVELPGHLLKGRVGALPLFVAAACALAGLVEGGWDREALQDLAGRLWVLGVAA